VLPNFGVFGGEKKHFAVKTVPAPVFFNSYSADSINSLPLIFEHKETYRCVRTFNNLCNSTPYKFGTNSIVCPYKYVLINNSPHHSTLHSFPYIVGLGNLTGGCNYNRITSGRIE
jgi:hypothetical protein